MAVLDLGKERLGFLSNIGIVNEDDRSLSTRITEAVGTIERRYSLAKEVLAEYVSPETLTFYEDAYRGKAFFDPAHSKRRRWFAIGRLRIPFPSVNSQA